MPTSIKSISAWHSSAALTNQGDYYYWGGYQNNSLLITTPIKVQSTSQFGVLKVGGAITLLSDISGRVLVHDSTETSLARNVNNLPQTLKYVAEL